MKHVIAFTLLLTLTSPALAQRNLKNIPDPDPELERKTFQVADGFEVNLFAADPQMAKPIQMNWDPAGRLWIASSSTYPQIKPGEEANDKILVLEDTDNDGVADKTTVFADGLLIPTAVAPGDGGAYVANSTELLHLRDTDGDGRADQRRIVLSGFGTEDTHHILHTFRWGPDGMLYMNQSIYIHSHVETPHGVRRLESGGIWHFRPQTMELDVYAKGFVNSWGHHFDRWGQSFATDGAYGEGINYVFPGATFVTYRYAKRILKGLNPGSPKHCSLEIVSGRHLPDDWQGDMITNDFRAHRVCRFKVTEDGSSSYQSKQQPEVIKTSHVAFRPIDVKMGPDGAIYIADWYNPIIQHGEVDFRDERRDHVHGRIWRVTAKGRPLVPKPKLVGASIGQLLEHLKAPEGWTREMAKRVLSERQADEVLPAVDRWLKNLEPSDEDIEHHRLEALWVYQTFDKVNPELLALLCRSPDHRVRAAATRVIYHWHDRIQNPLGILAAQAGDDHPRVRLEAVRALSQFKQPLAMELAMTALDKPIDPNLDFALWHTANDLAPYWLPALESGQLTFGGNARRLEFALAAVASPQVVQPLLKLVTEGKIPPQRQESLLALVAGIGNPQQLRVVFDRALSDEAKDSRAALLGALAQAASTRKTRPAGDLAGVVKLLDDGDENVQVAAAELSGVWKLAPAADKLAAVAVKADAPLRLRSAAIAALSRLRGKAAVEVISRLAAGAQPAAVQQAALSAWVPFDGKSAAARAIELLSAAENEAGTDELFGVFVHRKGGSNLLIAALADKKLPPDVAKVGVRVARGGAGNQQPLIDALRTAGGLTGQPKKLSPDELAKMVADVAEQGNPHRGEAVYRRKDLQCLKCHAIAGAGGKVGPDMISLGASAQVDYLIDSLLDPNAKVKENYHSVIVTTAEGKIYSGIKVRESKQELVLRDAQDQEIVIPTNQIDERVAGKSLMPTGLVDSLTRNELVDLVRFMSELGKVDGSFAVGKEPVVRRWQALKWTADAHRALNRTSFTTAATDDPRLEWDGAYSRVNGTLPVADLPSYQPHRTTPPTGFARFQVNVTTAGKLKLLLGDVSKLSLWVDSKPTDIKPEMVFDLAAGVHTFTLAVDKSREAPLRVELGEVEGSSARAHLVSGK